MSGVVNRIVYPWEGREPGLHESIMDLLFSRYRCLSMSPLASCNNSPNNSHRRWLDKNSLVKPSADDVLGMPTLTRSTSHHHHHQRCQSNVYQNFFELDYFFSLKSYQKWTLELKRSFKVLWVGPVIFVASSSSSSSNVSIKHFVELD